MRQAVAGSRKRSRSTRAVENQAVSKTARSADAVIEEAAAGPADMQLTDEAPPAPAAAVLVPEHFRYTRSQRSPSASGTSAHSPATDDTVSSAANTNAGRRNVRIVVQQHASEIRAGRARVPHGDEAKLPPASGPSSHRSSSASSSSSSSSAAAAAASLPDRSSRSSPSGRSDSQAAVCTTWTDRLPVPSHASTEDAIYQHLKSVAHMFLRDVLLVTSRTVAKQLQHQQYRLLEVEMYLWQPDLHSDPYTHKQSVQARNALFYFHKSGNSYKGGTYKGLDITFGNVAQGGGHGGMLIRTMQSVSTGKVVCGPCNCVNALLASAGYDSIAQLVDEGLLGDLSITGSEQGSSSRAPDEHRPLQCVYQANAAETVTSSPMILSSPRVGLHPRKPLAQASPADQLRFLFAPLRFLHSPARVVKGRHLAVIWQYHTLRLQLLQQQSMPDTSAALSRAALTAITQQACDAAACTLALGAACAAEYESGWSSVRAGSALSTEASAAAWKMVQCYVGGACSDKELCRCLGAVAGYWCCTSDRSSRSILMLALVICLISRHCYGQLLSLSHR